MATGADLLFVDKTTSRFRSELNVTPHNDNASPKNHLKRRTSSFFDAAWLAYPPYSQAQIA
ncbi:MAG: hypothetical protein HC788_03580 [Sphingopyxis sp.]|nr:hypothetical protein [Sphingopyxis sp.]